MCCLLMLAVVLSVCACSCWQQHVIAPYVCGTPSPGRCSCCCKATVTQCMSCQGTLLTLVLSCLPGMMAESYSGTLQLELRFKGGLFCASAVQNTPQSQHRASTQVATQQHLSLYCCLKY